MNHSMFKLQHPFTLMVAGPTSSGKTFLTRRLIEDYSVATTIAESPLKILWCYGVHQSLYKKPLGGTISIEYFDGLADESKIDSMKPNLIVIDDLMVEVESDKRMTSLFTKGSHHKNISVIFIVQNLKFDSKTFRNVSLNTHYFLLLKNPRDQSQIAHLAREMFNDKFRYMTGAYEEATSEPFSYLLVDLTSACPTKHRLRTRILSSETIKGDFDPIFYTMK